MNSRTLFQFVNTLYYYLTVEFLFLTVSSASFSEAPIYDVDLPVPVCEVRYFDRTLNNGTFLHITDVHIDPEYKPGTDPKSHCHMVSAESDGNVAGIYGTLGSRCDSPVKLADEVFRFMKQEFHGVDFIIYTGDSARHDRDHLKPRTSSDVIKDHGRVAKYFKDNFDLDRTLVIPTIGNNDALKHDQISQGEKEPIYKKLLNLWADFKGLDILIPGEAQTSFLKGGYWVQTMPRIPDVKVINLNSMFFYIANKQALDCDQPYSAGDEQLKWYEDALLKLEKANKKAYVMGHVPPKDENGHKILFNKCYQRFIEITGKHAPIISGMFWGHTNFDAISFITKTRGPHPKYTLTTLVGNSDKPNQSGEIVAVMTTGPSIIPFRHPALRSYHYDPGTGDLLGYTQYYANLTLANNNISSGLVFKKEYSTWQDYRLPALTLNYWKQFLSMLFINEPLWNLYSKYQNVSAPILG